MQASALSRTSLPQRTSGSLTDTFVGMYVNEWTVDYGERGRAAVRLLLDRGFEAGIIPHRVAVEFIG